MLAVLSQDPRTTLVLSLLIAILYIPLVWPNKVNSLYPVCKFQIIDELSNDPVTTFILSLLIAKLYI